MISHIASKNELFKDDRKGFEIEQRVHLKMKSWTEKNSEGFIWNKIDLHITVIFLEFYHIR